MIVHQMDVVTAFLNGELHEETYMCQPPGYEVTGKKNLVCRLKRSYMDSSNPRDAQTSPSRDSLLNLVLSRACRSLCIIQNQDGTMTIVTVYVEDLVVISSSFERLNAIKKALSGRFKMKDIGPLHYCLGV